MASCRSDSRIDAFNSRCRGAGDQAARGSDSIGDRRRTSDEETSHAYHAVSPRFPGHPVRGRRRGRPWRPGSLADEGPPETTTIRLACDPTICLAPGTSPRTCCARKASPISATCRGRLTLSTMVARGEIDFDLDTAAWVVSHLDAGEPITALAGVHSGCYELFAHEPIRTISDLKGKRVGIQSSARAGTCYSRSWRRMSGSTRTRTSTGSPAPTGNPMELFAEGKVDAFLGVPARAAGAARPQDRSRDPQHRPRTSHGRSTSAAWLFGNREFVRDHPVATKRVLRAILKAADICAAEPERAAQQLVDGGFTRALRLRAPDADRAPLRPAGASSTRRTRCASTRCGSTRSA